MVEQDDDFLVHLLIVETQIENILNEGKEEKTGGETVGLRQMLEESEAYLIGKDREMLVVKNLAGFLQLLLENSVFLIEI